VDWALHVQLASTAFPFFAHRSSAAPRGCSGGVLSAAGCNAWAASLAVWGVAECGWAGSSQQLAQCWVLGNGGFAGTRGCLPCTGKHCTSHAGLLRFPRPCR
jgi:hypothetical protein